jgi:hypothetical protein
VGRAAGVAAFGACGCDRAVPVGEDGGVPGAILIAIVLIAVLPAVFWAIVGLVAWILGTLLKDRAEDLHEGSELIATNV